MSCKGYQDKLIAALANGEGALGADDAMHLRACGECKKFYEAQVNLFGAIDSGIRGMVNETVPASLLPRVHARMEESHALRRVWNPGWRAVAFSAVVGAVSVGFVLRPGSWHITRPADVSVAVRVAAESIPGLPTVGKAEPAIGSQRKNSPGRVEPRLESSSASSEVLVLAEEREAYERYVKVIRVGTGYPAPATKLLEPIEIAPEEIAQLQIKKLEVNPLIEESEE